MPSWRLAIPARMVLGSLSASSAGVVSEMSALFTESEVESAALAWLESLGYAVLHGPEIAPGEPSAEREGYGQVVLDGLPRQAMQCLNHQTPPDALLPRSSSANYLCRMQSGPCTRSEDAYSG